LTGTAWRSELKLLASRRLSHLRLRLLQPLRHPHLAVHRRRGGEVLLRLLARARASWRMKYRA